MKLCTINGCHAAVRQFGTCKKKIPRDRRGGEMELELHQIAKHHLKFLCKIHGSCGNILYYVFISFPWFWRTIRLWYALIEFWKRKELKFPDFSENIWCALGRLSANVQGFYYKWMIFVNSEVPFRSPHPCFQVSTSMLLMHYDLYLGWNN